jgi:hypothetical protein
MPYVVVQGPDRRRPAPEGEALQAEEGEGMTDEKKPTRRLAASYKGATAVIHWGRYMVPTETVSQNDRLWLIGGGKHWVRACDEKYTALNTTKVLDPKMKPRVTCKKCVEKWGNGVR